MKDFLGNELNIEDSVVFTRYNQDRLYLLKGVVKGITDCFVKIYVSHKNKFYLVSGRFIIDITNINKDISF
jgi:hypothetical protein